MIPPTTPWEKRETSSHNFVSLSSVVETRLWFTKQSYAQPASTGQLSDTGFMQSSHLHAREFHACSPACSSQPVVTSPAALSASIIISPPVPSVPPGVILGWYLIWPPAPIGFPPTAVHIMPGLPPAIIPPEGLTYHMPGLTISDMSPGTVLG